MSAPPKGLRTSASAIGRRYTDAGDQGALAVIAFNEVAPDAWHNSDFEVVRQVLATRSPRRAVDVGAGTGRMIPTLAEHVSRLTIIEPDAGRRASARREAEGADLLLDATVATLDDVAESGCFDFILASHVVQHLADEALSDFIAALRRVAARGATLQVTAPLAASERAVLSVDRWGVATRVRSTANAAHHRGTTLVVHRTTGELAQALESAGFDVHTTLPYRSFSYLVRDEPAARGTDVSVVCGLR